MKNIFNNGNSSFSDNIRNSYNSLNHGNFIPQIFKFLYESCNLK